MRRLGVLGWPVAHSRSPAMHRAAFAALGLPDYSYQKLPVPPMVFDETVRALEASGFVGANVTIPHKEAALALADTATARARAIGAANTLSFADGAIDADNTDAPGFLAALDEAVAGRRALVHGAGGSARAVVWALRDAGADVLVLNRTRERAERLADELGATVVDAVQDADVYVNTTSIGLDDADASPLEPGDVARFGTVVDLVYRAGGTRLTRDAEAAGVRAVDGLEMLVRQGALSFERWTGMQPPLDVMRAAAAG